ncbi:MAG: IS1380 family transposase [Actinobacteria bacterium]|nr:IS1380 family transposase [Actinomycetota bacterium]MCA1700852.1 IS1380 family transposase [Actinomycetota bacterium]
MVHDLPDRSQVVFDDERVVVNAGIMLAVTLGQRLGIESLVDAAVKLGGRPGAWRPGRKVLSLIHAMLLGADCIDDCDVLRAGRTEAVLGHRAMAPSTLGTFLRSFTFGHVRQLDRVLGQALRGAWQAGAGPSKQRLVVDVDSFVGEVHGHQKQGAGYGYTQELGYHPLLATRSDTSEVLHVRLRKGAANTQRGALRFVDELLARVRRAGASGEILLRADSGFQNKKVTKRLREQGCRYSIGVTMQRHISERIAEIPDEHWQPVDDYPETGVCELAETTLGAERLVVRRVHLHAQEAQTELFAYWRHHAFITNRTEPLHEVDGEHRQHAQVELVIRDLKDQALAHFPSGHYSANSAWTVIACLAHNLGRWTDLLGLTDPTPRAAGTLRRRLFALPGRLTRTARRWTLHLPARWPWQADFLEALTRIRALPAVA